MNNPEISIIVPVYNVEKYIRPCLDSILAQTITDWECILVDDGSKDGSGKICDEYAARDTRFVVVHKQNDGVAKARITAFEHSKGELITFIDSDDYVSPEYLEKLSKPILEDGADMVSCEVCIVSNGIVKEYSHKISGTYEGVQIRDFISNHYYYERGCGYGMTCYLCTKMIKRDLVLAGLKYGLGLWYGEDQAAMLHILYSCKKLVLIPERMYFYVFHVGQATKSYKKSMWDSLIAFFEKCQELDQNHQAEKGLRIRSWIYVKDMIFNKMKSAPMSKDVFCAQLNDVLSHPYMRKLFSPLIVHPSTFKNLLAYWMIKLRLYSLLYRIVYNPRKKNI